MDDPHRSSIARASRRYGAHRGPGRPTLTPERWLGFLVQVGVLGPLQVRVDGDDVPIGSPSQRRLLAALAIRASEVVSVDTLIAALWGEEPPSTALESLRTYVYRLRAALGDAGETLVTRPPGYLMDVAAERTDAGRFERHLEAARTAPDPRERLDLLDDALALWRGPALAEFADEPFARGEAVRLEERRCVALEDRSDVKLRLAAEGGGDGLAAEVIADLHAFVEQHPFRERANAQLMVALHRTGRQADALAVGRRLRDRLADELGLDLPPTIARLENDILQRADHLERRAPVGASEHGAATGIDAPQRPPDLPRSARLPLDRGELYGRETDLATVRKHLRGSGLVTIVGIGGVGKTRLALRAAGQAVGFGDGVIWCELAPLGDDAEVAEAIATQLGVRTSGDARLVDAIAGHLTDRHTLLVLDNCEHVAAGVRELVAAISARCSTVTVLATSRSGLDVPGERLHRLAPLPVGDRTPGPAVGTSPALALLADRARAARPDLDVEGAERGHLADVARRLDGLPLAIELAASRLRALNPQDLADRLAGSLDLVAEVRPSGSRHDTLRSVIDWSYRLLSQHERRLLDRISVFAGPFTLEAAEQVGAGGALASGEVLDLLARLVDHSLVLTVPAGGPTRYTMLETVRTYAREQLATTEDAQLAYRRHAEYHIALAEDAATQIRARDEAIGVRRLDRTLDELRAVHRWVVHRSEVALATRLVLAVFRYALWRLRSEVLGWAAEIAELPGADQHHDFAAVAGAAGWAAGLAGDLEAASRWADRGLATLGAAADDDPRALLPLEVRMHCRLWQGHLEDCLAEARRGAAVTDDPYELVPHYVPGLALTYAGHPDEALELLDEVQVAADRLGNPTMRALVLYSRAEALIGREPERAMRLLQHAAEAAAAVDNRMMLGIVDVSLVSLLARHGDPEEALAAFMPVIDRLEAGGDRTHLWTGVRWLVTLLLRLGRDEDAAVLLGAVRTSTGAPPPYGEDAERLDAHESDLADRLGTDHLADLRTRGRAMADAEAFAFARQAIAGRSTLSVDEHPS